MVTARLNRPTPISVRAKNLFDRAKAVLLVSPVLAAVVGINNAHIISQIDYWLQNPLAGYMVDGEKWIYNGYSEWAAQLPWLSVDQIGRHIRALEARGLILSDNFHNTTRDRRKWYRLDYHAIAILTGWNPRKLKFKNNNEQPESASEPSTESFEAPRFQSVDLQNRICENPGSSLLGKAYPNLTTLSEESETDFLIFGKEEVDNQDDNDVTNSFLSQTDKVSKLLDDCIAPSNALSQVPLNTHEGQFSAAPDVTNSFLSQTDKVSKPLDDCIASSNALSQDRQDSHEGQFSAAAPAEKVEQPRKLKRVESNYALKGFNSQKERDGFYQKLLELGHNKSGIHSPVGWAASIIRSINDGGICEYLDEYRLGVPVGTCEKREWEIVPGKPLPQFVSYLKRRLRTNLHSDEQALAAAHKVLKDPNAAADLWNSCKRTIQKTSDQWKRDEAMGVNTPYLPPELLPEKEVELKDAAKAIIQLQSASIQCPTPSLQESQIKALDESNSDQAAKVEATEVLEAPDLETIKQEVEEKKVLLKSGPIGLAMVICWSRAFPGIVELVKDEQGKVIDLKLVEEVTPLSELQPTADDQGLEVEEGVVVKNENCEGQLIDCDSESG
jgi:hypothetical protein